MSRMKNDQFNRNSQDECDRRIEKVISNFEMLKKHNTIFHNFTPGVNDVEMAVFGFIAQKCQLFIG